MSTTINGTTGVSQVQDSIVTDSKLSLTANSEPIKTALNASGSAPIYACRAWVNFNGIGTVAIRASGNVSSITDNGTGNYTVNFTVAMPDANYSAPFSSGDDSISDMIAGVGDYTTSSCRITTRNGGNTGADAYYLSISIFR
jgi:hypothetical protein